MTLQEIGPKWGRTRNALIAFLFLALLLPWEVWPNSGPGKTIPFRLGGLRIGETLGHFKEVFPGSACGTVTRMPVNRHTLDDPDGSGSLTCCVDDPKLLSSFSEFTVLPVEGQCPVLLNFWKEKLSYVGFTVEVTSVEKLLPNFEKAYGPPDEVMHGPILRGHHVVEDREAPVSLASWRYGEAYFELSIAILDFANGHAHESRLVQVEMWRIGGSRW